VASDGFSGSMLNEMRRSRFAGSFSIKLVVLSTQKVPSSAARLKTQIGHLTVRCTSSVVGCVSEICCGGPGPEHVHAPGASHTKVGASTHVWLAW